MRQCLRIAVILLLPTCVGAQETSLAVPDRVKVDNVPPIPLSIVDAVAPYGQFRQARLLGWHPTARRILIATAFGNVTQVHEVRSPGGARTQLTFYRDGVTGGASYDPGGTYIVFRKDTSGGGEAMQLFRYELDTGRIVMLTDGKSRNSAPVWSHKRGVLAYVSTRRNGKDRDIWVMNPLAPTREQMIGEVDGTWEVLDWSADDKEILAVELIPGSTETRLWRIDVDSKRRTLVTPKAGRPARWTAATFGDGGRAVFALSDRDSDVMRVWRCNLATGAWALVTKPDLAIEGFAAAPVGNQLAVIADRGATSELQFVDTVTRRHRIVRSIAPGVISNLAWRPAGDAVGLEFAGARTFRDVYSVSSKTLAVERWTMSEMGGATQNALPDAEIVQWKSFDGRMIPGILYRPAKQFTGPRPVMINVHGGPETRERPRGLGRSNYFRNELGMAIIYPNIRGSSGYGNAYEHLDDGRNREDAVKDIGALLDWIATRPEFDKSRVMVTGSSYGGYITYASAIAYGDRIRCAFAGFGLSDFVAFLEGTDPSRRRDRLLEYGDPSDPDTRAFLKSISPLTHASRLKVPLFVAQGAKDTRVPMNQSEAMVRAVRANGTPVWYVVYDSGHEEFTQATNDFNLYAWVLFVQKYLLD
jgi:dipeptidyl aminopeptidase/acylaminoacyl peptidase